MSVRVPPARSNTIEVHLREIGQLFEQLDPSPFRERDLERSAEEFIVDRARELPAPSELVFHLEQPADHPDEERALDDAIRAHFARRSRLVRRDLHRLLRRGLISLGIGIAFLALLFVTVQVTGLIRAEAGFATVVRESMLIIGWVAMWRPLEIFLYDWWPIVRERRLHDRLSRIKVRIVRVGDTS
jgi:hypothetical protein